MRIPRTLRLITTGLAWLTLIAFALPVSAQSDTDIDCESVLEIWQIQGAGEQSNCQRTRIITEDNIVTGISPEGFFIQTPPERSDDNPATSDGIYVFTGLPPIGWDIQVGDRVTVEGRVTEYFDMSRLEATGRRRVTILSSGNPLPAPVDLGTITMDDLTMDFSQPHPLERYESMRVIFNDAPVVATTNYFDEFGVSLSGERAFREPGIERDLTPQFADLGLVEWDLNPEILEVDPPEMGLPPEQVAVGSVVSVSGNLGYAYRDYQIWATELDITPAEVTARPVRERESDEFTIATQNVENFFDLVDDPDRDDSTYEDYVPDDEATYQRRLNKVSEQIRVVLNAPDIVALQEMENENALNDLIQQIQTDDPDIVYQGCILEGNDGRGIDNAYLIRQGRVQVNACDRMPGSLDEPGVFGGTLYGRPPLVLEADLLTDSGDAVPITVINLHIKSLSGIETNETQLRRMAQAEGIAAYIQSRMDENPDINLIVAGDLNGFQFTDGLVDVVNIIAGTHSRVDTLNAPQQDTLETDLVNQVMRVPAEDRYSYIWNSNLQVLDHILTTPNLDAWVTDAQFSRGNADAITTLAETDDSALRSSDHDGFVIYLRPE